MRFASLTQLSPEAACNRLVTVDTERKLKLVEWLALIALIDERRDYRAAGYSSMSAFCMGRLHLTLDRSLRLIQVARVARRYPMAFEFLADGRLGLTTLSELAPALRVGNASELLEAAAHKTKEGIRRLLVDRAWAACGVVAAPSSLEARSEEPVAEHSEGREGSLSDLIAPASPDTSSAGYAPAHTGMTRRGRITPSAGGEYDVRLSITEDERAVLRRAEDLLGHAVPSGDLAEIYARAMKAYVAQLEKERFGAKRSASVATAVTKSRTPTREMRGFVEDRDGGQCTFIGPDGHRCEETRGLECDHIVPWCKGGPTTPSNLRLLCPVHNQFEAERELGKEYMQGRRESAERERALDPQATKAAHADEQRPEAGAVATGERHDDVCDALRALGYNETQAQRGARESKPGASLEDDVKAALAVLSRKCRHRGELMAKRKE
ncbi:MAG: HNH endonuclease [Candidatus Eisenbacteria bacterium]|nr:HNH endonuclease [Candidatus Eisenbacteria bacterium]